MRLVIPGAAGFVGVNLLQSLLEHESLVQTYEKIVLVDVLQYGEQKLSKEILSHPKIEFIKGSIYDTSVLNTAIRNGDDVIHLAVEENTFDNPQDSSPPRLDEYVRQLAEKNLHRLIYISTADIYGTNDADNITEEAVVKPTIMYAANKVAFEAYIQAYVSLNNLPAIIFRPVTIYGPHQFPGWLIPRVITKALKGETIQLTGDGSVRRDWIHVSDVCSLIVQALTSAKTNLAGEVFNVGTGAESTVIDATKFILDETGQSNDLINFIPARAGDIPRQITIADKARKYFDWSPTVSFEDGLRQTIAWYGNNLS